ncbi:divisome protein SepX/GlpR [Actinopolymorpha singaporensis]
MGTGLIYAAIVAAWAVYLVPLWLRRHDEATAARPVDDVPSEDVPSTSRVLARRQSARPAESGGQVAVPPQRTSSTSPEFSPAYAHAHRRGSAPGVSAAARRRRTLFLLTVLTTLAAVLSMAGVVGWWSVLVSVGLTAGFLVVSAAAARRERARRWAEEPVARRTTDSRGFDDRREAPSPRTVSRHAMPARVARAGAGGTYDPGRVAGRDATWSTPAGRVDREAERQARPSFDQDRGRDVTVETPPMTAAAYAPSVPSVPSAPPGPAVETPVPVAPSQVSLGPAVPSGELWDPVRVPLPTYVTKAKAPRTVRTVDLAQSGIWAAAGTPADGLLTRPDDAPKMLLDESGAGDRSDADRRTGQGERDSGDAGRRAVGD